MRVIVPRLNAYEDLTYRCNLRSWQGSKVTISIAGSDFGYSWRPVTLTASEKPIFFRRRNQAAVAFVTKTGAIIEAPTSPHSKWFFTCAAHGVFIYVFAGTKFFSRFDTVKGTWKALSDCPADKSCWKYHLVSNSCKLLLVASGDDSVTRIYEYRSLQDEWNFVTEYTGRYIFPVSTKGQQLIYFAYGTPIFEADEEENAPQGLLRYDLVDGFWSEIILPATLKKFGTFALYAKCKDGVIAFLKLGKVKFYLFDPEKKSLIRFGFDESGQYMLPIYYFSEPCLLELCYK